MGIVRCARLPQTVSGIVFLTCYSAMSRDTSS
jgi:hypothetical protein